MLQVLIDIDFVIVLGQFCFGTFRLFPFSSIFKWIAFACRRELHCMLASCCYWSLISVLVDAFCFELDSFYRLSKKCTYLKMVLWLNPLNVLLFVHCIFASILNASTSFL